MRFEHRFVEDIPDALEPQVLYIALDCGAVVHLCACGCGNESVTPLGRTDWSIIYDGETISLSPSVGNWSFACRSHYFITKDNVRWAPKWSSKQIDEGRQDDRAMKSGILMPDKDVGSESVAPLPGHAKEGWMKRLRSWWAG